MQRHHLLKITYALNFFVAFHAAVTVYINSSALATFFAESTVSILYAASSVVSIFALVFISRYLKNAGDVRATAVLTVLELGVLFLLAFPPSAAVFVIAFVLHLMFVRMLQLDVDIFLETVGDKRSEGSERGLLLTIGSIAFALSPLLVGWLLGDTSAYGRAYLVSALMLVPALVLVLFSFRHFKDPVYVRLAVFATLRRILRIAYLRRIFFAGFLLRFFYAVMVIYTPIYLHTVIGLSWENIGLVFTIMLLPFVFLEYPLGRLADKKYGEKEMLALGFIITGIATILVSLTASTSVVVWACVLLATRIGAATIETMTEVYFFKKAAAGDAEVLGMFRILDPVAYLAAPLLVAFLLFVVSIQWVFAILGAIMLSGAVVALRLQDTR